MGEGPQEGPGKRREEGALTSQDGDMSEGKTRRLIFCPV